MTRGRRPRCAFSTRSRSTSILAVIPARKGTKDKALWKLAGKPLIEWALEACLGMEVIVITDSDAVAEHCQSVTTKKVVRRPWELSTPSSLVVDLLHPHVGNWAVLVQPTAPFIRNEHIWACAESDFPYASKQTIIPVQHNAHWMNQRTMDGFVFEGRGQNSQGKPAAYQFGNCIGFGRKSLSARNLYLEPSLKIEIPRWYGIDIDDEEDLKLAEAILDKGLVDLS